MVCGLGWAILLDGIPVVSKGPSVKGTWYHLGPPVGMSDSVEPTSCPGVTLGVKTLNRYGITSVAGKKKVK